MESIKKQIITLILNKQETQWLKTLVQNPIIPGCDNCPPVSLEDENPRDAEMRKKFWDALWGVE